MLISNIFAPNQKDSINLYFYIQADKKNTYSPNWKTAKTNRIYFFKEIKYQPKTNELHEQIYLSAKQNHFIRSIHCFNRLRFSFPAYIHSTNPGRRINQFKTMAYCRRRNQHYSQRRFCNHLAGSIYQRVFIYGQPYQRPGCAYICQQQH
jgi:hypothetical protein